VGSGRKEGWAVYSHCYLLFETGGQDPVGSRRKEGWAVYCTAIAIFFLRQEDRIMWFQVLRHGWLDCSLKISYS
jgi:hypothetical protein